MSTPSSDLQPVVNQILTQNHLKLNNTHLDSLRETAFDYLKTHGLRKESREKWRCFDTREVERVEYQLANADSKRDHQPLLESVTFAEDSVRIVILNGVYRPDLSDPADDFDLVTFDKLDEADQQLLFEKMSHFSEAAFKNDPFVMLNRAATPHVYVLKVDKEVEVQNPVHVIYLIDDDGAEDQPVMAHPQLLLKLGQGSKLTLVEEWLTTGITPFVNTFTYLYVGRNASLEHVRVQRSGEDAFHVDRLGIEVDRDALYNSCSYAYGGAHARSDIHLQLVAPGSVATLDGVAVLAQRQEVETHSVIENAAPHVNSHQLHKIVVDQQAHGIFNGNILVRPGAQRIEAKQLNRNLLLSDKARVDAKPQLEIFADDVVCSHGSATGQLSASELFYLQARGLAYHKARAILTYAFAAEVIERINIPSLKERLAEEVFERLHIAL